MYVVIAAYNEEKSIGRVIRGLFENGFTNVVVIDDGSADRTADEAARAGAKVVKHVINRGQGAALRTGNDFVFAHDAELAVHFDADGQFNPADIGAAEKLLHENNLDIVFGSRFLDKRSKIPWQKKYFVLPIARMINFFITGVRLTDAHNGFRLMNRRAHEMITITQDRMAHNSEIVAKARRAKLKYAECPVEVRYNEYGQSAFSGLAILRDLLFGKFF
jgi:glycosyltransferase involved in cell wall biosynthesis